MPDVTTWLRGLGLEQYATAFVENEVDELSLPSLTAEDLRDLGVTAIGHRRRLLDGIAALRAETSGDPQRGGNSATVTPPPAKRQRPELSTGAAKHRLLTVMFCDIVGSTSLSTQIDPENLRDVINAYHKVVVKTVVRFDGFVAQYLGDGVLIYFGYPQAHEDDAEGAVRAGLAVIHATAELSGSVALQVRVGIASGTVVVDDLIGGSQERGVVGVTPNLAAGVATLAEPETMVIAERTRVQVVGLFDLEDLGPQELKGFDEPQHAWRVLGESGVASRFEILRSRETPHRHRRGHRHRKSTTGLRNLFVGIILAGLIPPLWLAFSKIETPKHNDTTTKTGVNASAPAQWLTQLDTQSVAPEQKSTESDTQSVRGDQRRPPQSTSTDLETRMGRLFERDQYYLDKNLGENADVSRLAPRVPPSKLVPIDDKLTAEEVFASHNEGKVQIPNPMFNGRDLTTEALSEGERLRYLGLVRIHRMAVLTLYNNRCFVAGMEDARRIGDSAKELATIESQFKKLPREVQEKALDHQTKAIESRSAFYDKGRLIFPGGFSWFCEKMTNDINEGYADPMFMTAREGFFPIEGN